MAWMSTTVRDPNAAPGVRPIAVIKITVYSLADGDNTVDVAAPLSADWARQAGGTNATAYPVLLKAASKALGHTLSWLAQTPPPTTSAVGSQPPTSNESALAIIGITMLSLADGDSSVSVHTPFNVANQSWVAAGGTAAVGYPMLLAASSKALTSSLTSLANTPTSSSGS